MKYLALLLLCSCYSREVQVTKVYGKAIKVETLTRYDGDLKRVTWTLSDRTQRVQYLKEGEAVVEPGTVEVFLIPR